MTATAGCLAATVPASGAERPARLTTAAKTAAVGGDFASVRSQCGGKSGAVSVGFGTPFADPAGGGGPNVITTESRRDRLRGSLASGFDSAVSGQGKLTTRAYCLRPALRLRTARAAQEVDQSVGTAVAACPGRTRIVSGGFSAGTGEVLLLPFTSKRLGKRKWTVSAYNPVAEFASDTLTAYAYCAKRAPKVRAIDVSTTTQPATLSTLRPKCKRGRTAIAGGFESFATAGRFANTYASQRYKRGWQIIAAGTGSGPTTARAFAYCARL